MSTAKNIEVPKVYVRWSDPNLDHFVSTQIVTDTGLTNWSVVYSYGMMRDGTLVNVVLPFETIPKGRFSGFVTDHCKQDGIDPVSSGFWKSLVRIW